MSGTKTRPVTPPPEQFRRAQAAGAAEQRCDFGIEYLRIHSDCRGLPRGSLLINGQVVAAYPSIARIFALASGVRENFDGRFVGEEKIDGYNLRIFQVDGEPVAVTRSGIICPFSRDRLPDLIDPDALRKLFATHPDLVLCAEVTGPGNPYMATDSRRWGDDVALFCFDVMRFSNPEFMPVTERRNMLDRFGIPQTPILGEFEPDDLAPLAEQILKLDAEGAEGVVLKPHAGGLRLKYVTPSINLTDVTTDAALELELPGEFYTQRVVRMVMALRELGQQARQTEMAEAFGRALVNGFSCALEEVESQGSLGRCFRIRLREQASIDALFRHLQHGSRTVDVQEVGRRWDGSHYEVVFRKVFRKSSSRLKTLLAGGPIFD